MEADDRDLGAGFVVLVDHEDKLHIHLLANTLFPNLGEHDVEHLDDVLPIGIRGRLKHLAGVVAEKIADGNTGQFAIAEDFIDFGARLGIEEDEIGAGLAKKRENDPFDPLKTRLQTENGPAEAQGAGCEPSGGLDGAPVLCRQDAVHPREQHPFALLHCAVCQGGSGR